MILTMWYCFIVPLFHSFSKYFLNARYFIKYGGGKIYRTQVFDTRSIKKKKKTDANKTRCHCMVLRKKHDLCQQLLFLSR